MADGIEARTPIRVDIADAVATVTIDRPARRNAMTLAMWRDLGAAFQALGADPAVRAIILAGAADHFCAGADISEFATARDGAAGAETYGEAVDGCADAILSAPQPTIAALRGFCLGGGSLLALSCDFRVADPTVTVGIPAAKLSIVYGVGPTRRLMALVGLAAAKRILFTGAQIDAAEAHRIGFIDRIAPGALDAAYGLAGEMRDSAPMTVRGAKLILDGSVSGQDGVDVETVRRLAAQAADSADHLEGRRAFAEKRRPIFRGR